MIYLVSRNQELFSNDLFKNISVKESIDILKSWNLCQYDSETSGKDAHICNILSMQFGSIDKSTQIVVDCTTISPLEYKGELERMLLIGQNLKFDLQFLYKYEIIPLRVYDTMIVEQVLYLGFPYLKIYPAEYEEGNYDFPYIKVKDKNDIILYQLSFSLKALEWRYFHKEMDKTVRGEIIWRGLDDKVIEYAANDVVDLYDIMLIQLRLCNEKGCYNAAKLECEFVPVIAYMEWCGIKLDQNKWKAKMEKDLANLVEAKKALDNFVINNPDLKEFTYVDTQGDLFSGFNTEPQCTVSWSSSQQVIKVAKKLGFNTVVQDKNTGEDKDSVIEKQLKKQKGINDEFLRLYLGQGDEGDEDYFAGHQGANKVVTSFGQGHLNAINPITGRIHTSYKQLGADTGRMSCGNKNINIDLAKLKKLPLDVTTAMKKKGISSCSYPNMQQLPSDEITRACFVAEKSNNWVSCDYSAIESRLGADIYNEPAMIEEFLHGSGDIHSLVAKMIFPELKDVSIKDIKKYHKHLRSKAKPVEFSQQFGGSPEAIRNSMGCSKEEAEAYAAGYNNGFKGIARFKAIGERAVKNLGYILLNPLTGHKTYWWDWEYWKKVQQSFTSEFWDDYRLNHKGTGDIIAMKVSKHFKSASKWSRKALNSVTQGTGAIILKESQIDVFRWVVSNNYFNKVLLVNLTHDEANWEYPKDLIEFPSILKSMMENTASKYCKSLPIPADAEISDHWVH